MLIAGLLVLPIAAELQPVAGEDSLSILPRRSAPIDGGDPKWGETALMRAAAFGQRAPVQALLSAGANPLAESAGKLTALHAAAEGGDVDIIRDLLTKGLPVDGGADRGDTPLTVACAARPPAAVEALVAAGARHEAMGSDCGTLADLIGRTLANSTGHETCRSSAPSSVRGPDSRWPGASRACRSRPCSPTAIGPMRRKSRGC